MSGERHDQVIARLRVALHEEADLAMVQADVGSAFVEFGARLHRDRRRRAARAIAACLALLAAITAVGITRENAQRQPVIEPPTPDRGGPRLHDPARCRSNLGQEFTGHGRRYFSPGFGPEFSFVEPASRWSIGGPVSAHGVAAPKGRTPPRSPLSGARRQQQLDADTHLPDLAQSARRQLPAVPSAARHRSVAGRQPAPRRRPAAIPTPSPGCPRSESMRG